MKLGIVLIHGYTGNPSEMQPLVDQLVQNYGQDSVKNLALPGHDSEATPEFNDILFKETIYQAIKGYQQQNRKLVIIGHSTGGNLALATLHQYSLRPDLLIMVSVPKTIDREYFARWESHRTDKSCIPLIDVAMMVKFINSTGLIRFNEGFPILIMNGESDRLVLSSEAHAWQRENFPDTSRVVTIPEAGHNIFYDTNSQFAIDLINRAINDLSSCNENASKIIRSLIDTELEFAAFFQNTPFSKRHLVACPSTQRVIERAPELQVTAENDPVIANIEITTFCNLRCRFCARTQLNKVNRHMSFDSFANILAILPNLYKVVLVGLGEPLMHPEITRFIQYAKSLHKKVGLVTNAMLLTPEKSHQLLEAGLDSIAFSLDGYDHHLSSLVRQGTQFEKVIDNIKDFVKISNETRKISKAVFSAVSMDTVANLQDLINLIADLGVDVAMLSDINFKTNSEHTLWKNIDEALEEKVRKAVTYAFSKNLPVLSVHGLEEIGLEKRYHQFLMIPPSQLYQRSIDHTWCFSPWQTIPIDVQGNITLCDCQPELVIGNIFKDAFSDIWNGATIKKYRAAMVSQQPPDACKICPRF